MTVLMIVIDGLGVRSVTPRAMPTLSDWGAGGLSRPAGATAVMCASTYPNFASIVSGATPDEHGMLANRVLIEGRPTNGALVGIGLPSFLDEESEVVVGDQNLIGVIRAETAGSHWPESGKIPPGIETDQFGYVADAEVTSRVITAMERRPDLVFAQINSPDTVAHIHGPDSTEAIDAYSEVDRHLAAIGTAVNWEEDLVLVTSDHDQERVEPSNRIDLHTAAWDSGIEVTVIHEGTAAVLSGAGIESPVWLEHVPEVQYLADARTQSGLAFAPPGWWFGDEGSPPLKGAHGGPRTRSTVAIAAGSPTEIDLLRPRFLGPRLGAEDWFGLVQFARMGSDHARYRAEPIHEQLHDRSSRRR